MDLASSSGIAGICAFDRAAGLALDPPEAGSIRVYRLCLGCLRAARGLGIIATGIGDEPCIIV